MDKFQKLNRFPLGAIRAGGFLEEQLKLGKDGMAGWLYRLEPDMIANPFVNKTWVRAWSYKDQDGWGAEISGNYWTGYILHAYTLRDGDMIRTAEEWVEGFLKNRQPDGYLGTYTGKDAKIYDDFNAWGTACGMRALLAFYEATGREDVLDAVYDCMLWFCKTWVGDKKSTYLGIFMIEPMIFTYYYKKDQRLIDFCEEYIDFLCRHDLYNCSYKAALYKDFQYLSYHSVLMGAVARLYALVYSVTGNEEYLRASEEFIRKNREKSVQLTGAPVSATEYNGPVGATRESEYCCFTTINTSYAYLGYITGQASYGDFMEEVFYNAAQGARKKDEKAIAYLTAPNQFYATDTSSAVFKDMQVYAPCYPISCCPVMSVIIVPDFVRSMFLRDDEDNIYAVAYGPCSLKYGNIDIREDTLYPFRNSVRFEINCNREFTLHLKKPQWCKKASVKVNGEIVDAQANENGYIPVTKAWAYGDVVEISFDAEIQVIRIDDSDSSAKYPIAIKYGALVYSYHVPEKWTAIPGTPMTRLPEGWSWYNVTADYKEYDVEDIHEMMVRRRGQFSWNIAVDENLTAKDFEIEEVEPDGYAWSHPYIKLHTHCYKAPYVTALYESKTFEPIGQYQPVTDRLPLTLVPYGCTNLRITYFPKADLKNKKS